MIWLPKNAEADLVWWVVSCLQKTKCKSFSLLQSLILSDTSAVIFASWWLCLENFSIIKWQYEKHLNAKNKAILAFLQLKFLQFFCQFDGNVVLLFNIMGICASI